MYTEYYITMDSFGQDCPTNWEEIAAWLNEKIDTMEGILDENGDLTMEGRDMIDALWESYCAGDLEDAPAPIME